MPMPDDFNPNMPEPVERKCPECGSEDRMTVGDLRGLLEDVDGDLLVGTEDQDGVTCEIQFAGVVSDDKGRGQYFFIRANGGFPLFGDPQ